MIHLKPGEKVRMKVRKHWFILFEQVMVLGFVFVAPFILYALFNGDGRITALLGDAVATDHATALFFFGSTLWALAIWMKLAAAWTDYYLDIWVVTDHRIVDIEQKGFFNREIATLRIERIQDVTVHTKGIVATILNFGDIRVQSAGESREFTVHGVPDPRGIKEYILKRHDDVVGHTS